MNTTGEEYDDSWQRPPKLRDANGKKKGEVGYDPSTVFIPDDVKNNFTPVLVI